MRHSSNPVVNMFSESFVRVPAPCIALAFLACCSSLVADPIVIAPGNGVSTNVVTLYSGETELSVNPGASEGGIVTLNKWNMHTGGTSLGCGTLVMTGAGEMGQASPVGTGAFSPGAGTVRYIGPAGGVFYGNVAPSFASGSTSACVFDVQNDLTYSGAWNQHFGGFIKTGSGTLSIAGKSNSTNWFGAADLTGGTGVFTDAMLARKLVFNANGDAPAEGFGGFSVIEGTFRIAGGVNVFGTETAASASQVGAWTTDEGAEKSAVLEIAGGKNTFVGRVVVGKQNGSATTGGDKVHTGIKVSGGQATFKKRLILGWNGDTTSYPNLDSRPFYEQSGGTVKFSESINLGYDNARGVQASIYMTGGTIDLGGKNIVSGYNATYTTNTVDVSGSAVLGGVGTVYTHAGAGNRMDVNVHDNGTIGFNAFTNGNATAQTNLRVDGGVLRNEKSNSSSTKYFPWIGGVESVRLTSFVIGPKGATFTTDNGDSAGVAQVYSPITAEPAGEGETATGVTIAKGRFAYYLSMNYEGPTIIKNGGVLYLSKFGELPNASAVRVEGGGMLRLLGIDKSVSSLTLEENATLGFGTPSSGANAPVLTVTDSLVLPDRARIALYTLATPEGVEKSENGTYVVLKAPASNADALRAVKWICSSITDRKTPTFEVNTNGGYATLSVTISDAPTDDWTYPAGTITSTSDNLSVSTNLNIYGTLQVKNSVSGSENGGSLTIHDGGVLDVSNGDIITSSFLDKVFDLYLNNGGSIVVKNIQNPTNEWDEGSYFHFNGGTIYPVYGASWGFQMLLNYQYATLGEHGLTIDLSRWVRPDDDPGWVRVSIQGGINHDPDCAGPDGGIVIQGGSDEKLQVYFGGRMNPSAFNGAVLVKDGCIVSSYSYALLDKTLIMEPGTRLRPFFASDTEPISVQIGSLTIGAAGATKPVAIDTSNVQSLLGCYVVSNSVSVLSPVELGTAANWDSDIGISAGTFTTLVYRAECSVTSALFSLSADATAAGYTLSAEEVTISGGDYDGWKALVCTVSRTSNTANDLVVTGSASYPSPLTVSTNAVLGKIIVGGAYGGEADPCTDTELALSGNVTLTDALYLGYYPAGEGTIQTGDQPHQGFFTLNGGTLSTPRVYSVYRHEAPTDNSNSRYGCEITINNGLLDVAGDVMFAYNRGKYNDKHYSRLYVNGGRVAVGGKFYLQYCNVKDSLTSPGSIVLNDGEVDVRGLVDMARNIKKQDGCAAYEKLFGIWLNGGVLKAENIMMSAAATSPQLVFNGGTFMPYGKSAANRAMQNLNVAYVSTNGAIVSTANMPEGSMYTIAQPLLTDPALNGDVDGGFTKRGAGYLTLSAANTFTGPVRVEEGALVAANASAISDDVKLSDSAALVLGDGTSSATFNSITASGMVAGNVTVTNRIDASDGLYLTVGGALTIDRRTTVDFGLEPGAAPSSAWIPVATASGDIDVPGRIRAVNCGEGMPHCKMFVADKVVYMRPAAPMLMLMVR